MDGRDSIKLARSASDFLQKKEITEQKEEDINIFITLVDDDEPQEEPAEKEKKVWQQ